MTVTETDTKLPPDTEPQPEESKSIFKIESEEDFRRLFSIISGLDPDSQQIINKFMDFDNKVERSNLATRADVHLMAFLEMVSNAFFPQRLDNPFALLRDAIATASMAKGGWKADGFVEIVRQVPSLAELQGISEQTNRGIRARIFGGSSGE